MHGASEIKAQFIHHTLRVKAVVSFALYMDLHVHVPA